MHSLFKPTSYKKGAALAVEATFVWKAISFLNALLLAAYFGATFKTDVYFYLIMLIGFGVGFLQRLNQTVLIPEAMFLQQENPKSAQQFLNMWLYLYMGLGALVALAGICCPQEIWQLVARFNGPLLVQDKHLLACGGILFALQIITYYLIAVTEMYQFFKTAWLGVLNALCPLVCLLIWGSQIGIISMVYGFLAANLLQLLVLGTLLRTQLHWNFSPAWVSLRVRTRQNMVTGQVLAVLDIVNNLLPIYLISGMGTGLVSALNYCKQLTDSTTEVFTARVANVAKIEMTSYAAQNNQPAFHHAFIQLNHLLLVLLAPLVIFSYYFAPQIVELFFERGHFGVQAAQDTVAFLRPMLFTILLLVPAYLQSNTLSAWRKIKENFPYSCCTSVAFTIALLVFVPRWGAFSYPYVYVAALLTGWIVSYIFFRRHFPHVPFLKTVWDFIRLLILNLLALMPPALLAHTVTFHSAFSTLLTCGSIFVAGYVLALSISKDGTQFLQEIKTSKIP